jgi:anti-anti-sigma factor
LAVAQCGGASCELVRPGPHAAVVVLAGEHDVTTLPVLRQVLAPLSLDSGLLVVIDLSRATFIDAAVLTALGGVEQAVTGRGGRFGLLPGTAPAVLRMLDLTGWLRRPCAIAGDNAGRWDFLAARAAR